MSKNVYPYHPVLIVDDEDGILDIYTYRLKSGGITNVICSKDGREVMRILGEKETEVILLDLTMPFLSGEKLLPVIRKEYPDIPVIIVTGTDEVSIAVECMRMGAFDYLVKPVENSRLVSSVQRALEIRGLKRENRVLRKRFLSNKLERPQVFSKIITISNNMRSLFIYIESISGTKWPVLITGETGVGKESIADAVHALSGRKGEYVKINVSGLDDNMFSDTLFGHRKGAFTGAAESRDGMVEKASAGTLFLDEIGDLSAGSQIKLLRLLEAGEYFSLGSDTVRKSDARIVVAINRELTELIDSGRFRKDLYYRLSAHEVAVPPLRERREDIPLLIDYFIDEAAKEMEKKKPLVLPDVYTVFKNYDFPGNIRELKSMIFDAVSRSRDDKISLNLFKTIIGKRGGKRGISVCKDSTGPAIIFTDRFPTLKGVTRLVIEEAMNRSKNQAAAAKLLGISPAALSKRIKAARNQ